MLGNIEQRRASVLAVVAVSLLALAGPAAAGPISSTASSMSAGTFVDITSQFGSSWQGGRVLGCGNGVADSITQYSNAAVWNPIAKRLQLAGSPHSPCSGGNSKAVFFDDTTNTWGVLPNPNPGANDPRHSYGHNTVNPATGEHYWHDYNSTSNLVLCMSGSCNGTTSSGWRALAPIPSDIQVAESQAFFPDRNTLIRVDGNFGVWEYRPSNNTWTQLAMGNTNDGSGKPQWLAGGANYPTYSGYSSKCRCVIIAAGGPFLKYNADGTKTDLNKSGGPSPELLNAATDNKSAMVIDPVSGELLVMPSNSRTIFAFAPGTSTTSTGSWRTMPYQYPAFFASPIWDLPSAAIPEYGVIVFLAGGDDSVSQRVYLYKHAPSGPPQPAPSFPTNVIAR